MRYGHFRFKLA